MTELKPNIDTSEEEEADQYECTVDEDGVMRCSCGSELVKLDDTTYKCPGGYPIYRFDDDTIFIDKFGNLCIKNIDHENPKDEGNKKNE